MDMNRVEKVNQLSELIEGAIEYSEVNGNFSITIPNESAKTIIQTIKQQQDQLEQRKKALNFYADPKTYEGNVTDQWDPRTPIDEDSGNQARKALEQS